jgi:hypothetical protein
MDAAATFALGSVIATLVLLPVVLAIGSWYATRRDPKH